MISEITIGDLVQYVLKHRKGNAFKDYNEYLIATGIENALYEGTLFYALREDGNICGIALGKWHESTKVMDVLEMLTTERWAFPAILKSFRQRFPDGNLIALRRWKPKVYNTNKFYKKVLKGDI